MLINKAFRLACCPPSADDRPNLSGLVPKLTNGQGDEEPDFPCPPSDSFHVCTYLVMAEGTRRILLTHRIVSLANCRMVSAADRTTPEAWSWLKARSSAV